MVGNGENFSIGTDQWVVREALGLHNDNEAKFLGKSKNNLIQMANIEYFHITQRLRCYHSTSGFTSLGRNPLCMVNVQESVR